MFGRERYSFEIVEPLGSLEDTTDDWVRKEFALEVSKDSNLSMWTTMKSVSNG